MKNNKGFSLVELIIVIAIMAVLIGVMAPQYIRYVEKSRISTDESNVDSLLTTVKTSLSDEKATASLTKAPLEVLTVNGTSAQLSCPATNSLAASITATLDTGWTNTKLTSTKYKSSTYTISVIYDTAAEGYKAVGAWN